METSRQFLILHIIVDKEPNSHYANI